MDRIAIQVQERPNGHPKRGLKKDIIQDIKGQAGISEMEELLGKDYIT